MFNYYGSKSKIIHLYPKPIFNKIIEPFAGSARYALKYFDREVLLVDKYEAVVRIWKFLQQCSPKDILGLPKLTRGLDLTSLGLSEDEVLFLGFIAGAGTAEPRKTVSPFGAFVGKRRANTYKRIADNLYKIRHWDVRLGSYEDIPNQEATWYIDPPYVFGGDAYKKSSKKLDFGNLADWCKARIGQSIVCENIKANWLPFKPMVTRKGASNLYNTEAIWSNLPTNYDFVQGNLF